MEIDSTIASWPAGRKHARHNLMQRSAAIHSTGQDNIKPFLSAATGCKSIFRPAMSIPSSVAVLWIAQLHLLTRARGSARTIRPWQIYSAYSLRRFANLKPSEFLIGFIGFIKPCIYGCCWSNRVLCCCCKKHSDRFATGFETTRITTSTDTNKTDEH